MNTKEENHEECFVYGKNMFNFREGYVLPRNLYELKTDREGDWRVPFSLATFDPKKRYCAVNGNNLVRYNIYACAGTYFF